MVDYYYTDGNETFGPYSIDQLKSKNLSPDTLVWHERLPEWAQLRHLPEIATYTSGNRTPPPVPASLKKNRQPKTEIENARMAHGRTVYLQAEEIIISRRVIRWLMIWTFFHIFALLTSYKELPFFNENGEPRPNHFWPFVNFFDEYYVKEPVATGQLPETRLRFNGIFVNYDWTEFGCYVGGLLLMVVFYYLYKKAD
jgi:hypothetical protein